MTSKNEATILQLSIPGISGPSGIGDVANFLNIWPGKEVTYQGNVSGGPRFGASGIVKETLSRRVVVDMGRFGIWHVPYYFLAVPRPNMEAA